MAATVPSKFPGIPTAHDSALARDSAQTLAGIKTPEVHLKLEEQGHRETIVLPLAAVQLLQRILSEMAQGNAVTIMPVRAELTTQQAADLLNVSRPHLIGLLESGQIKYHRVGTHRRILLKHLLEYKRRSREASKKAMQELADLSQELELGY